jgi:nitroimidazol reductase NimA-like FMN-containing flavoprotein (pyridoxamine 5'-phosphate oxidase superfamily)
MLIRERTIEECWAALRTAGFGRLGCTSDNQPYVVPIYFSVEARNVYSFSLPGQKLDWMRANARVCVEVDQVASRNDWTSVIATGRYEELTDTLQYRDERAHAHEILLRDHTMWWQPGAITVAGQDRKRGIVPVFYRIEIANVTGYRGVPALDEGPRAAGA